MKQLKLSLAVATVALAALAGCASNPTADIHVHAAPDANLSSYSTFGFPEQTGTDRPTAATGLGSARQRERGSNRENGKSGGKPSLGVHG